MWLVLQEEVASAPSRPAVAASSPIAEGLGSPLSTMTGSELRCPNRKIAERSAKFPKGPKIEKIQDLENFKRD